MCILSSLRVAAHGDTADRMDEAESQRETRGASAYSLATLTITHNLICTQTDRNKSIDLYLFLFEQLPFLFILCVVMMRTAFERAQTSGWLLTRAISFYRMGRGYGEHKCVSGSATLSSTQCTNYIRCRPNNRMSRLIHFYALFSLKCLHYFHKWLLK